MSGRGGIVVVLAQRGVRPADIACQLGMQRDTVYAHLRKARLAGMDIPHFKTGAPGRKHVNLASLPPEASQYFEAEARKRGMDQKTIIRRLLILVAEDDLAGALLDDGKGAP
ncbi:helix-turn-helix transcriptional regulator [Fodinicurvata sediminis]|uniref:helix-turn-helix transcriptional regulator n=1 Tax=Fodinicurvata sediminis TaxID=1121832 RepID=UPI0003B6077D|nr:helix-turn-helix transcriptional regulator [Fodinicurvata sediminis]